jgi:monofunctional biosynthetic peptidoglycan transglycosylase
MKTLVLIIMGLTLIKGDDILFDFSSPEKSGKWYTINDDVMGGISKSNMILNEDGTATFKGNVSLENNGGFASIRSRIDLGGETEFSGVAVRVKGDGNYYNIRFRTNTNFDGYAYQAKIKTEKDNWKEYKIHFEDFKPTFRGYTLRNKPALKSKDIAQIGFLISDKQSGNFEMSIDWIKFYE